MDLPHPTPWLPYSPELFFRFQCYWALVLDRQRNRPDMRLPFHALGGERDRVWTRYTEDRQQARLRLPDPTSARDLALSSLAPWPRAS